jgi:hypothetical protein
MIKSKTYTAEEARRIQAEMEEKECAHNFESAMHRIEMDILSGGWAKKKLKMRLFRINVERLKDLGYTVIHQEENIYMVCY